MSKTGFDNCRVCGNPGSVEYPLLPGHPTFCSEHHNPKDAGPFGCDFSGPDDFDIPDEDLYLPNSYEVPTDGRGTPIWTTKDRQHIKLTKMEDSHVINCLRFLKRRESNGDITLEGKDIVDAWIPIFEKEVKKRKLKVDLQIGSTQYDPERDPNDGRAH